MQPCSAKSAVIVPAGIDNLGEIPCVEPCPCRERARPQPCDYSDDALGTTHPSRLVAPPFPLDRHARDQCRCSVVCRKRSVLGRQEREPRFSGCKRRFLGIQENSFEECGGPSPAAGSRRRPASTRTRRLAASRAAQHQDRRSASCRWPDRRCPVPEQLAVVTRSSPHRVGVDDTEPTCVLDKRSDDLGRCVDCPKYRDD